MRLARSHIPWAEPRYWGNEERFALDALRSTWISGGPYVERLEAEVARYCGSPQCVATSNGTTALHAAFLGVGLAPGDEVVVPAFAFMAAANVVLHMGAKPVFADVDADTWCLTAETVAACVTSRTKGIVPVHSYGNVCDMDPLLRLAGEHGLWVVEDAAEAFGSRYRGRRAGSIAATGTYSFHATKTITTGEGGAVVTRDEAVAQRMRLYRSHGVKARRYWHEVPGHNFRLTNLQAAIGCAQLEHIEAITAERARVHRGYVQALRAVSGVRLQAMTAHVEPIVWAIAMQLEADVFPQGRDAVMAALGEAGIETRPGFHAASEMPHLYEAPGTPCSDRLGRQVISLPSSPTVTDEEITFIAGRLAAAACRS
jgi:perosamine synthetase